MLPKFTVSFDVVLWFPKHAVIQFISVYSLCALGFIDVLLTNCSSSRYVPPSQELLDHHQTPIEFRVLDVFFCIVFALELLLRMGAAGTQFFCVGDYPTFDVQSRAHYVENASVTTTTPQVFVL